MQHTPLFPPGESRIQMAAVVSTCPHIQNDALGLPPLEHDKKPSPDTQLQFRLAVLDDTEHAFDVQHAGVCRSVEDEVDLTAEALESRHDLRFTPKG